MVPRGTFFTNLNYRNMSKTKDQIGQEALAVAIPLRKAGIGVTVGGGKTLIGLKHMDFCLSKNKKAQFLVVGPKLEVLKTWREEAVKHGFKHLITHFTFSTYLSLTKLDPTDYDGIYLDECHSLKYSHHPWLSSYGGTILGLTGTVPKFERSEKGKMVKEFCPIVYEYDTDEAVEDSILNDYEIIIHSLPLSEVRNIQMNKNGKTWFTSERDSYQFWSRRIDTAHSSKDLQISRIMRMRVLQDFTGKEKYAKSLIQGMPHKVLIFANTKDQADRICSDSFHSGNPLSDENLRKFKEGTITKLAAVHQLSEGVNIPDLKIAVILHAYSNERKSHQRLGRILRLKPDEKATLHVLCYKNTVDEDWVQNALSGLNQDKIRWL